MIGVIDFKAGNLRSVESALRFLHADFFLSADPAAFAGADRMIFPGVGEARAAMTELGKSGLDETVRSFYASGKPLLGICIGCQIALDASEERSVRCLGLVKGRVQRFARRPGLKIPHMGWNQVNPRRDHPVWAGIKPGSSFYFVHSYYPKPEERDVVLAETEYGISFASALGCGNFVATQFHPEKSGKVGLKLLANFLEWKP